MECMIMEWRHLTETLIKYAELLQERYKNNLTSAGAVASGKLRDSVHYQLKIDDYYLEVGLFLHDY